MAKKYSRNFIIKNILFEMVKNMSSHASVWNACRRARDLYTKIKIISLNLTVNIIFNKSDILDIKKLKLNGPLIHFYFY